MLDPEDLLKRMFEAALHAASPEHVLAAHLPPPPAGRTVVIGAGKAAASMAAAVEAHWPGPLSGLVVTRYGHAVALRRITLVEAAHPVPDLAGSEAAQRILDLVSGLGPEDLVLCLISGGGSALLSLPAPGVSLADKRHVTAQLLKSGASISEINTVRKHLSAIKGGRLALAAAPAQLMTLVISDVPGDDPSFIASGPTVADPTSFADARAVLAKYRIEPPPAVARHLEAARDETPKPGDPRLSRSRIAMVARSIDALNAAAAEAGRAGVTPIVLGDAIEGESREVGRAFAGIALAAHRHHLPAKPPMVILSGGETTVTVRGHGRGGRNLEFLLGFGLAVDQVPGIFAIACDTDGIDGTESNAGALWRPDTLARARARGLDPARLLADNDAYTLFAAVEDLVVTGPTLTNVNDFRAILVAGDQ